MDTRWQSDGGTVVCGGLRLALQRIASSHWRAEGVLRSWALAPLHREGDRLCVPCGASEVLWLGAWLEGSGRAGALSLRDREAGVEARLDLAHGYALTAIGQQPLALREAESSRVFALDLHAGAEVPVSIELELMEPAVWTAMSGRAWSALPDRPPPLPPRLG